MIVKVGQILSSRRCARMQDEQKSRYAWCACAILALGMAIAISACTLKLKDDHLPLPAITVLDPPPVPVSTASDGFTNFETEPVKPLALSGNGRFLYALNTADDRLEIFDTQHEPPRSIGETTVGLRPVAIALRGEEAWIVNHLSDSVSVVDISDPARPRVIRTLQVGDEPRGIVIGGPNHDRVFVATARRDATLTPNIGRAQVWIFDAAKAESPAKVLTLFGTKPRSLAVSADGRYVYAAIFHSGNRTATVSGEAIVKLGRAKQVDPDHEAYPSAIPKQGVIVQRTQQGWRDIAGTDWSKAVPFELPDSDVFVIDASAVEPKVVQTISGVGTTLFNLAVQPGSGEIWVTNTEARNLELYEPNLKGRFASNRISRIRLQDGGRDEVTTVELNPHLSDSAKGKQVVARALSLAQPLDLVFEPNGATAYVSAFGSRKVAVINSAGLVVDRIDVGFGPAGLALDAKRGRLYVLNHLDASLSIIDTQTRRNVSLVLLKHDPTPEIIKLGRPFLYDAMRTSRHGDLSCATCHAFGDMDGLAWDLGDPAGAMMEHPTALKRTGIARPRQKLHPIKGPMVTQSLRGLKDTGPYHWRGDRFGDPLKPGEDMASFKDFNVAFVDLMGRAEVLDPASLDAFARFVMTIRYPPNPNQSLDRARSAEAQLGYAFFTGPFRSDVGQFNCVGCHALPTGTNRLINFEGIEVGRDMKTPHLRNVYDKIGRFNTAGPQVSGFGLVHDGTMDTVVNFLRLNVVEFGFFKLALFNFPGNTEAEKDIVRTQLHHFVMSFDSGTAPAVGRQVTISKAVKDSDKRMLAQLGARANVGDCDLIARGWEGNVQRGWLHRDGQYYGDRPGEQTLTLSALIERFINAREPVTFTCVPPGDGRRSAFDRNMTGDRVGDKTRAGSNPNRVKSVPYPVLSLH